MSLKNKPLTKVSLQDLPDLLTIREVASLLRVSALTIKRWGKKGKLPAIRINSRGDRRYKKSVVLKLLGEIEEVV
jgi:excisionase family DNA binding protein